MTTTYDAIILGAGHNGLILQAYLGKAGLKTLAIDRRPVAGGGLSTEVASVGLSEYSSAEKAGSLFEKFRDGMKDCKSEKVGERR